ncbi:hypothetical protein RESH_05383 [Rhodopirellula europaea SH398]|uniref:Uncharacterized protein n=1 Tax=Rhodopirellula europaea SH398 TaxID=1263868 RepID=M5RXX5_9BACT|nr:hypothetical protein RESH_05383 [Rhodopirellula europaea SH398]
MFLCQATLLQGLKRVQQIKAGQPKVDSVKDVVLCRIGFSYRAVTRTP